jgi:hypothetical protein
MTRWSAALLAICGLGCGGEAPVEGRLMARLFAPASLSNEARSVVVYVLDGTRVDRSPLACSTLLESDGDPFSSDFYLLREEPVDVSASSPSVTIDGIPVGSRRVFFLEVYDQPGGLGNRLAVGCTAAVEVGTRAPVEVDITLMTLGG